MTIERLTELVRFVERIRDLYGDAVGDFSKHIVENVKDLLDRLGKSIATGRATQRENDELKSEIKRLLKLLEEQDELIDRLRNNR